MRRSGAAIGPYRWILASLLLVLALPAPVVATHSVPSFPYLWDYDVDGIPEATDSIVKYQQGGGSWTADKTARLQNALAAWRNGTDFNPELIASSLNRIYVDGTAPWCNDNQWSLGMIALACRQQTYRGTYYQIYNSKIYLNEVSYNFSWVDDLPPPGVYDGRGILTHELGHAVRLIDLYGSGNCPPGPTMCGSVTAAQSLSLGSLSSDDIAAANAVYQP